MSLSANMESLGFQFVRNAREYGDLFREYSFSGKHIIEEPTHPVFPAFVSIDKYKNWIAVKFIPLFQFKEILLEVTGEMWQTGDEVWDNWLSMDPRNYMSPVHEKIYQAMIETKVGELTPTDDT